MLQTFLAALLVIVLLVFWAYAELASYTGRGRMIQGWIVTIAGWFGKDLEAMEPGVQRRKVDWKHEVFMLTRQVATYDQHLTQSKLMAYVYKKLRPRILAYGEPDPVIFKEIEPLFECVHHNGRVTGLQDYERVYHRVSL